MKHKGQMWYFLHPGDLKRYRKEKDFKWEDIRKIAYYPEEIAEQAEQEKKFLKRKKKEPEVEIPEEYLEMSEEELKKMIDEYLTDDRLFEEVKDVVNQRKPQRIVINLPGWLKEQLKQKSIETGTSMNAVMRLALTEYLAKGE
jgi:predicted glutamine amidotransferase